MCYQSHNWSIFHHPCHKIFSLTLLGIPQVIQLKHNFSWRLKNKCSIWECFKFIEVKSNALFLSTFGVKIDVLNKRKRVSRMCENAYLSIKNPKASRARLRALDPGHRMLASLRRQLSASEAGAPPWPNPGSAPGEPGTFKVDLRSTSINVKEPFNHNLFINLLLKYYNFDFAFTSSWCERTFNMWSALRLCCATETRRCYLGPFLIQQCGRNLVHYWIPDLSSVEIIRDPRVLNPLGFSPKTCYKIVCKSSSS